MQVAFCCRWHCSERQTEAEGGREDDRDSELGGCSC